MDRDEEDAREGERVKRSYTPEAQEQNEKFVQDLGAFCEKEHPAIVMNGVASVLVSYFTHYYPEKSLDVFLGYMARAYRTKIRERELQ